MLAADVPPPRLHGCMSCFRRLCSSDSKLNRISQQAFAVGKDGAAEALWIFDLEGVTDERPQQSHSPRLVLGRLTSVIVTTGNVPCT